MANEQNLKVLTPSEAREYGRIGGIVSGQVRRERSKMRELALTMANTKIPIDYKYNDNEWFRKFNIENPTITEVIVAQLLDQARYGNLKAIKMFLDLTTERLTQPFHVSGGSLTQQEIKVSYRAKQQEYTPK